MKKIVMAIASSIVITGCTSTTTPTITNTRNIKEHILKDNLSYDAFSSYKDSDTIIRLPNGKYIHGTKKLDGKYYDSDSDSGAIKAKEAEYYTLLGMDANYYVDEKFQGFDDSDKVVYQKDGSFTNGATVVDENGEEKTVDSNKGITVKEAKKKEYDSYIQNDSKEEKKNLSSNVSELSKLLPKTDYVSRVVLNKKNKYAIHYYNVEQNDYSDYIKKINEKGFDSIDPNSPEETFLGKNKDNVLMGIHYDAATKIIDLEIRRQ